MSREYWCPDGCARLNIEGMMSKPLYECPVCKRKFPMVICGCCGNNMPGDDWKDGGHEKTPPATGDCIINGKVRGPCVFPNCMLATMNKDASSEECPHNSVFIKKERRAHR